MTPEPAFFLQDDVCLSLTVWGAPQRNRSTAPSHEPEEKGRCENIYIYTSGLLVLEVIYCYCLLVLVGRGRRIYAHTHAQAPQEGVFLPPGGSGREAGGEGGK